MGNRGDRLMVGEVLRPNDYLVSYNGLYYGIMQDNGDFVVFHGSGPDNNHGFVYHTNTTIDEPAFMVMQGDGNLCLYRGTPESRGDWLWGLNDGKARVPLADSRNWGSVAVMQGDGNFVVYSPRGEVIWGDDNVPVISKIEASVNYDLNARTTVDVNDPNQVPLTVDNYNATDSAQTRTLTYSKAYTQTSSWSASDSITVGVSVEFTAVPILDEGNVTISASETHTYSWGTTESETNTITAEVPVNAGAYEDVKCTAILQQREFTIPYSGSATYHYQDGAVVPGAISGNYSGTTYFLMAQTTKNDIPH